MPVYERHFFGRSPQASRIRPRVSSALLHNKLRASLNVTVVETRRNSTSGVKSFAPLSSRTTRGRFIYCNAVPPRGHYRHVLRHCLFRTHPDDCCVTFPHQRGISFVRYTLPRLSRATGIIESNDGNRSTGNHKNENFFIPPATGLLRDLVLSGQSQGRRNHFFSWPRDSPFYIAEKKLPVNAVANCCLDAQQSCIYLSSPSMCCDFQLGQRCFQPPFLLCDHPLDFNSHADELYYFTVHMYSGVATLPTEVVA